MSLISKKFPYVVVLKNTTDRAFTVLAILLNVVSGVFFFQEFILVGPLDLRAVALAVLVGILVWNIVKERKGGKPFYDRAYLVTALLWMGMPYLQWLFIPFVVLAILEHQVKFPLEIGFSENQIVFNTLFRKKYHWSDLSNVMLKDGLLTIDFSNNRLMQREVVDDEDEDDASEEEFNLFCRQQLKKNRA
jgi:NADH:ubiquinone oxidoreductase subunit 6 (subunit J)